MIEFRNKDLEFPGGPVGEGSDLVTALVVGMVSGLELLHATGTPKKGESVIKTDSLLV